jgi:hypothetical protein
VSSQPEAAMSSSGKEKTIRDEAKDQSASFYLTLVSIIQSFALGFLLSTIGGIQASSPTRLVHVEAFDRYGPFIYRLGHLALGSSNVPRSNSQLVQGVQRSTVRRD